MTSPRRPPILPAVLLTLLGTALLAGWWWLAPTSAPRPVEVPALAPRPSAPAPPDDHDDFVGSAVCATCHGEISRRYESHPMWHAAEVTSPGSTPRSKTGEPLRFQTPPYRYEVELAGDQVIHHEQLLDSRGRVVTDQSAVASYSMGSGVRGKSYLIDRGGILYQSPISWYSQEQRWDLSPGYTLDLSDTRFERRVTDDCLSCHIGRVEIADRNTPDRLKSPPFLELGVGCERCHGPGRRHVELFEAGQVPDGADPLIVNPDSLDPWRRDSICFQCHLSAKRVPRYGRRHYDFRPGQGIDEIWTVLVHPDDTGDGTPDKAVSHVQEMYSSRCYRESEGRFTCTSCHDAHGVPTAAERSQYYQDRCLKCHDDRGCSAPEVERLAPPASGSCVHCHMPSRAAGDIAHTSQTDHRIRRRPSPPADPAADEAPLVFFAAMDAGLQRWEQLRAQGLAAAEEAYAFRRQDSSKLLRSAEILKEAHALQPGDPRIMQALGAIYFLAEQDAEARAWFEKVLQYDPQDEESLKMLGIACYRLGDFAAGLKHLKRAIEVNPWSAEIYARYALMAAVFNDLPTAIAAARQGLELAPTLVPLRTDLVKFLEQAGRSREAAAERQKLIQIETLVE